MPGMLLEAPVSPAALIACCWLVPPGTRPALPTYNPAIGAVLTQPWFHEAARKAREAATILETHNVGRGEVSIAVGRGWLLVREEVDHG